MTCNLGRQLDDTITNEALYQTCRLSRLQNEERLNGAFNRFRVLRNYLLNVGFGYINLSFVGGNENIFR